jgi:hypothetical protein
MNYKSLLLLLTLTIITNILHAATITGRVTEEKTGRPIEFANVFLASTTFGTVTNTNGEFILRVSRSGVYKITVTHLSYNTWIQEITITTQDISNLEIKLAENVNELQAVKVTTTDPNRQTHLELFTSKFLGSSRNSDRCKILNPGAIWFYKNNEKGYIKAFADSMILIENKSLGYLIRYKLDYFYIDAKGAVFSGSPLFEDLLPKMLFKKRIIARRRETYAGSIQHFIRSLYADSLQKDGFLVLKLEEANLQKKEDFSILSNPLLVSAKGKYLKQTKAPENLSPFVLTDSLGHKILKYTTPFKVIYTRESEDRRYREDVTYWGLERSRKEQASVLKVYNKKGVVIFDNGAYPVSDLIVAGYMGWKTFADKLPLDFDPMATHPED